MTFRLSCALLAIAACGSSNNTKTVDSGTSVDAPPTAAMVCATSSMSRCTKLMGCSPSELTRRWGDLATCVTRSTLTCTEALAAPMTGNTTTTTEACTAALQAETCSDYFQKVPPAACTTQVGPETGACSFPAQCTSGFCSLDANDLCATCAPQPKVGDSCATVGCGQDLVCVTTTMLCQSPGALSAACTRDLPCGDGLTCVGTTVTPPVNGVCMAEVATAGATCDSKHKTGADCSLDDGLACNTSTNTCVTQPLAPAGMPCGPINNVETRCEAGSSCTIPTGMTTGTCTAPAADGAACDSVAGPGCFSPARCVPTNVGSTAGTCQLPGSMTCQ